MSHVPLSTRRLGTSLVEVLVAVSICSALFALLMPAVQKVRSSAVRLSCQSNLRQIGLATQHYESAYGRLPPAYQRRATGTSTPHLQWPFLIAPYLELEPSHTAALEDFKKSSDVFLPTPHRGVSQPLKPFACPADSRVDVAWDVKFAYSLARPRPVIMTQRVALNSYLGCAGTLSELRDGVIVADSGPTLLSVTDGTSNTIMFGERPPPANVLHGWLYVGWGVKGYGALDSVIGVRDLNRFPVLAPERNCGPGPFAFRQPVLNANPDCAPFQFWSLHGGGANFAFCDGSVRFLSYSADAILPALSTRAGGEIVEVP